MPAKDPLPEPFMFQSYGITLLEKQHPLIRKLKKHYQPSIHGHKTWLSSFLLMDYLLHKRLLKKSYQVMELGCGWGPASIFCAKHAGCRVTGLDRDDHVFPYLEVLATLNNVGVETCQGSFEKLSKSLLTPYQVLLGADICFWDELAEIHLRLIKRALKAGVKHLLFADPGRSPFFSLAEKCQSQFDADCIEWYSAEPEHFEGYLLHIRNN